jgi:hypothetical protein
LNATSPGCCRTGKGINGQSIKRHRLSSIADERGYNLMAGLHREQARRRQQPTGYRPSTERQKTCPPEPAAITPPQIASTRSAEIGRAATMPHGTPGFSDGRRAITLTQQQPIRGNHLIGSRSECDRFIE